MFPSADFPSRRVGSSSSFASQSDGFGDFAIFMVVVLLIMVLVAALLVRDIGQFDPRSYRIVGISRGLLTITVMGSSGLGLLWYLNNWRPALVRAQALVEAADEIVDGHLDPGPSPNLRGDLLRHQREHPGGG